MTASPYSPIPFFDPDFKADPYPLYARLQVEAPVCRAELQDVSPVFVVSRYADVRAALKDGRLVKNILNARHSSATTMAQAMINASMLRADPPEHTRLRALAHEAFTPKFVNQLRGRIQEIAHNLVEVVQAREEGEMDLITDFAFPLPITVICEMLGVPTADSDRFRVWTGAMLASGTLSSETPQITPEMLQLLDYLQAIIAERREQPRADLISALIRAREQGDHLNETELLGTTLLLLIAGHETTVNLIGNGMLALLQQPDTWETLRQQLATETNEHKKGVEKKRQIVAEVVEELLRLVNPVQLVNRYASEAVVIGDVTIPRGSHIMLFLGAANHDTAFAGAHPDDFHRARHNNTQHVAFGQGIHYCLGAPLARLEGEIALGVLLRRLPRLKLAVPPRDLQWRPSFELRGLVSLPVTF
jgi:cytochrome P450